MELFSELTSIRAEVLSETRGLSAMHERARSALNTISQDAASEPLVDSAEDAEALVDAIGAAWKASETLRQVDLTDVMAALRQRFDAANDTFYRLRWAAELGACPQTSVLLSAHRAQYVREAAVAHAVPRRGSARLPAAGVCTLHSRCSHGHPAFAARGITSCFSRDQPGRCGLAAVRPLTATIDERLCVTLAARGNEGGKQPDQLHEMRRGCDLGGSFIELLDG